jgi:hypothetical protein
VLIEFYVVDGKLNVFVGYSDRDVQYTTKNKDLNGFLKYFTLQLWIFLVSVLGKKVFNVFYMFTFLSQCFIVN